MKTAPAAAIIAFFIIAILLVEVRTRPYSAEEGGPFRINFWPFGAHVTIVDAFGKF
jgi:hypothetical protein